MIKPMTKEERLAAIARTDPREARKQALKHRIEQLKREWDQLSRSHKGVRPSWVSGDLSSLETRLLFMRRELEELNDE